MPGIPGVVICNKKRHNMDAPLKNQRDEAIEAAKCWGAMLSIKMGIMIHPSHLLILHSYPLCKLGSEALGIECRHWLDEDTLIFVAWLQFE